MTDDRPYLPHTREAQHLDEMARRRQRQAESAERVRNWERQGRAARAARFANRWPCLSVRQPWAYWLVIGAKTIENRGWFPREYRNGPVWIHASRGMTPEEYENACSFAHSIGAPIPDPRELARGAVVGFATLVRCLFPRDEELEEQKAQAWGYEAKRALQWWNRDSLGWLFTNARTLAHPVPARGDRGLFALDDETEGRCRLEIVE